MTTYKVLVTCKSGTDVLIEADNVDEAKKKAILLVESNRGIYPDSERSDIEAEDVETVTATELEIDVAKNNSKRFEEVLKEINED